MSVASTIDDDGIGLITIDDGGKNVFGLETLEQLLKAVEAVADARAVVTAGRDGVFSAGLDLKHIQEHGIEGAKTLVRMLGEVSMRLWTDPRPTVCAATGHAIAGGTVLAMTHDHVVAADGPFKWGLTETRVNLEVPAFAMELAADRLSRRDQWTWVLPGTPASAADAVRIGYADELAAPGAVLARAVAIAKERAELPAGAYAGNKARLLGDRPDRLAADAERDLELVTRHLDL